MRYIILTFALALTMILSGCKSDDPAVDAQGEARVSISVAPPEPGGRAQQPVRDNELIHDWWLCFVSDLSGNVEAVMQSDATASEGYESTPVQPVSLRRGRYTVYAFGNLGALPAAVKADIAAVASGKPLPDGFLSPAEFADVYPDPNQLIPMSGTLSVSITGPTSVTVTVVRMLAKIEFELSNGCGDDISVTAATFGDLYAGAVERFASENNIPGPAVTGDASTPRVTFQEAASIAAGSGATLYRHFYVSETSSLGHPTGRFHFSIVMNRGEREEEQLYALASNVTGTDATITAIRRNDYIQIPVSLVDWTLKLDVLFFPPIGGYPPMVKEENVNEYYIEFGSSGVFILKNTVSRGTAGAELDPSDFDVTIDAVTGDTGILAGQLRVEDGEITGEIATGHTGTAMVTCSVTVRPDGATPRTFKRYFYIIRN